MLQLILNYKIIEQQISRQNVHKILNMSNEGSILTTNQCLFWLRIWHIVI